MGPIDAYLTLLDDLNGEGLELVKEYIQMIHRSGQYAARLDHIKDYRKKPTAQSRKSAAGKAGSKAGTRL